MSRSIKVIFFVLLLSGVLCAPAAYATNGYFGHGYSTAEKGLAGAGVAHSFDSMTSATNPAGLVTVGSRFDIGLALFSPSRQYTVEGTPSGATGSFPLAPGTYQSDNDLFLIPHVGFNSMINDHSSWGVAIYGNGGMNSSYDGASVSNGPGNPSGTFGGGTAGVNLEQLFVNLSYASYVSPRHSFGVSAIMAYQRFKAEGMSAFGMMGYSQDPQNMTNNGHDSSVGYGARLGWQGMIIQDVLTMGASYQFKIDMTEFDKYAGLFADGGDFDIPATATIGLAWKTGASSTLVFDVQKIYYEDVAAISNSVENLFAVPGGALDNRLGGANGAGFGWNNMTIYKLGFELEKNITWRGGVSYCEQPITGGGENVPPPNGSEVLFNILAPAVVQTHLAAGLTMPLATRSELTFAFTYALSNTVKGATQFDTQTVELEMSQFEAQLSYGLRF